MAEPVTISQYPQGFLGAQASQPFVLVVFISTVVVFVFLVGITWLINVFIRYLFSCHWRYYRDISYHMRNGMYRPKEAADYLGVVDSTLRRYVMEGKITPVAKTPGGMKLYSRESLDTLLGVKPVPDTPVTVFYARVSGHTNTVDGQVEKLESAYGTPVKVYKDIASGLREGRPGLKKLLDDAEDHKYSRICITAKDRLTRFGFSYLERLLTAYGVTITVLDDAEEKTPHEELMQDFRSLKHEKMLLNDASKELADREEE